MRERILAIALLTSTTLPTYAANIDVDNNVINISGTIGPNDLLVLEVETSGLDKPMVVSLHSDGGSFLPAIRIGALIRQKGWSTHVEGVHVSLRPNLALRVPEIDVDGRQDWLSSGV